MSEKIELKPCPFCGGIGTLWSIDECKTVYAVCMNCGIRTIDYKHSSEAITAWNTRTPDIVRCVECKSYDHGCCAVVRFAGDDHIIPMKPDDFCSYGQRKEAGK